MISTVFREFDVFLEKNDHESMDWCDGGEFEIAERLIGTFKEGDWNTLGEVWQNRSIRWQGCLVSILCPQYGVVAQDILVQMASSNNSDIAFEAMHAVSFYCGINANSEGLFFDESIVHNEFKDKLSADSEFLKTIPKIGDLVGRKYEMLQNILRGKP